MMQVTADLISPLQAAVLGLVEGITEYLPVSSTGHLVVTSQLLGLRDVASHTPDQISALEAYEIVIQSGAILAVIALYWKHLKKLVQGLWRQKPQAWAEASKLLLAFSPAMVLGLLLHRIIKEYLQNTLPVIFALAVGGVVMIIYEKTRGGKATQRSGKSMQDLSYREAFLVGCAQCIAMWPGTSRSMVTILMGRVCGLSAASAAEFSFLLGLPTLLAATAYKLLKDGRVLAENISVSSMSIGLVVAGIAAFIAVKAFVSFLNRRGLAVFGYYRIIFAAVVFFIVGY